MTEHHSTEDDLRQHRFDKLARIRERGDEPYKYDFDRSCSIRAACLAYENAEDAGISPESIDIPVSVAGRMMTSRKMGKTTFADLRDESGKIQLWLNAKSLGEAGYESLKDLDLGDFLGVSGKVKRTKTGEITVFVDTLTLLTKSIRALPEKYHGLTDVETRYRQRYLDMIANPEVLDVFRKRAALVTAVREFLVGRGYIEVETPMMHQIPGGATARPFVTHHNTYDRDLFLRVAPELYLKRIIVGGFEKVFEINRNFRNEGVDTRHNPEFTMLELYQAYEDYQGLMIETEDLFCATMAAVAGGLEFEYQGEKIDAKRAWKRYTLFGAIREFAGIDLESTRDRGEAAKRAQSAGIEITPVMGYGKIVDEVMSAKVQPNLVQPTILYDYPIELSPLAKRHRENPALTERFQVFIGRLELCNAFSELNDPVDQRGRFEAQAALRAGGDDEAQHLDEDYLTALEIGMPPTAGLGIGIDRLAMLLTDSGSIRDVIIFPQLRPSH